MKKTLIALAALAATGAFAQSVTLYGKADVAVGSADKAGGYIGLANDKFQALASGTLNNGNSRFGLKGVEDLGGGLSALFNYEGGINIANGAGNSSGGQLFSRAANVSLKGGFGELRAGRTLTTSFFSVASWELTGTANYSVVANQFGFGGVGPRDSAAVMYNSPAFGGFSFSGSMMNEGNAAATGYAKGKYDVSATYAQGPIVVSAAFNSADNDAAGKTEGSVIGGKYDFGSFAVAGSFASLKVAGATVGEGYTLGVSAPLGPITLTFDTATDTKVSGNDTDYVLEAKYALSKRTFLYAVYLRDGKGKTANDISGYSLGINHAF